MQQIGSSIQQTYGTRGIYLAVIIIFVEYDKYKSLEILLKEKVIVTGTGRMDNNKMVGLSKDREKRKGL